MTSSRFATEFNFNVGGHMTAGRQGQKIDRIVIHHNASTADVIPGVWQTRQASAHYQVTPNAIRQCVDEGNTAWHAGNWAMNLRSIGIEHLNSTGAPSWQVSPKTIERSAQLVADICNRYDISIDREHIIKHSEVPRATSCPGGLDIDKLVARARELAGQTELPSTAVPATPKPEQHSGGGWLYFDYRGNVRNEPTTTGNVYATYNAGAWVRFDGFVHGQVVSGSDKWLRTARSKKYVHESVTGGTYGLPDLGDYTFQSSTNNGGRVAQNGTYRATANMKIRRSPSLSGDVAGTFTKGSTQHYDSYIDAGGYRWVSWIGASGNRNYVARRNLQTGEVYGECY